MPGVLKNGFLFLVFTVSLYPVFLLLMINPWLQRHALYAHKLHSGFWHDVNSPESFGFAKRQVTPFNLTTADEEVLYGWHILPLDVVSAHREALAATESQDHDLPLHLLKSDPEARVIINFHGNAGHVAQGWRTDTYRALTTQPHTHVFTIDYRGFGLSTGAPTEPGLITDGTTLANFVLSLGIPPSRIVILGQSLGTAVATAVGLRFADGDSDLLPKTPSGVTSPTFFAGIVLVAPFTSLPNLMLSYRIGGLIPVLAPISNFPFLVDTVCSFIRDEWPTALRLQAYASAAATARSKHGAGGGGGDVQILHARDDADISYHQSEILFATVAGRGTEELAVGKHVAGCVGVEILEFGGHNRVVTYAPVGLAVMRAFGGV